MIPDFSVHVQIIPNKQRTFASKIRVENRNFFYRIKKVPCVQNIRNYLCYLIKHTPSKLHTKKPLSISYPYCSLKHQPPLGYALDLLVTVSSIHYCTSTSALSTSSSSRGLTTFVGISHLEGGFTLRCLQRLSPPGLATLPWP